MRLIYLVVLVIILAAVVIFAFQNDENVSLKFFEWSMSVRMPLLIAAVYVLGMLSGWSVFGFLKRSIQRVTPRVSRSSASAM